MYCTYIHTYISYHFGGSIDMKLVRRRETSTSINRLDTDTIVEEWLLS
jgi:hypothetical protein